MLGTPPSPNRNPAYFTEYARIYILFVIKKFQKIKSRNLECVGEELNEIYTSAGINHSLNRGCL